MARPLRPATFLAGSPPRGRFGALGLFAVLACSDGPLDQAQRLSEAGRHREAGESYLAAARAYPGLLAAWDGAVDAFCNKEVRIGRCLEVLDLELSMLGPVPRHRDALSAALERRARLRLERGMVEAAFADLGRAARAGPERASVFSARARAHLARGERTAAEHALRRALLLDPGLEEAEDLVGEFTNTSTTSTGDPESRFGGPAERLRGPAPEPVPSAMKPSAAPLPGRARLP